MATSEEADSELFDDVFLADDDLAEFGFESLEFFAELIDCGDIVLRKGGSCFARRRLRCRRFR